MDSIFTTAREAARECTSLLNPSLVNFAFSTCILLGILGSYIPQHYKIIARGSSEGISPLFVLLGATGGTCGFVNILILSQGVLGCCQKGIGGFNCIAASLGVVQVGMQWTCFAVILLLFLIYFPRASPLASPATSRNSPPERAALTVTLLSVLHFVIVVACTFYFSLLTSEDTPHTPETIPQPSRQLVAWANFLGVQAMVLAGLQYIPQLYTTWTLKHAGSLSIPMMCIQTPGSFVWAISLATREGTKWSSWATFVLTGMLQGALLVMCVVWEMKNKNEGTKDSATVDQDEAERRPLIGNETS
ncbi:hypothetical protein P167DRAFT_529688 [Morchella conica CCBAS932]|uniref:PQ loop repeat protein n=1 Tax=Morchella conica CCBAS932 TaxID=1392247 RepID=A0A3N4KAZ3_9PEZI|nr:hypothetical protein P167DRAFT_529688 [Morchella conica CCBAS932]